MTAVLWIVVFAFWVFYGYLWSKEQRRKSVQQSYNNILEEVRQEHQGN